MQHIGTCIRNDQMFRGDIEKLIRDKDDKRDYDRILDTLRSLIDKYGRKYCYPSQQTILRLLERYHGKTMSRRTLNRRLGEMSRIGLIHRIRRIKAGNRFASTAYYICDVAVDTVFKAAKPISRVLRFFRVPELAHYIKEKTLYSNKVKDTAAPPTWNDVKNKPKWLQEFWQRRYSGAAVPD